MSWFQYNMDQDSAEPKLEGLDSSWFPLSPPAGRLGRAAGRHRPQWAGLCGGCGQLGRRLRPQEQTRRLHPGHPVPALDQGPDGSLSRIRLWSAWLQISCFTSQTAKLPAAVLRLAKIKSLSCFPNFLPNPELPLVEHLLRKN